MASSKDTKTFAGYQTLSEEDRQNLLSGHPEVLSSLWKEERSRVESATCPRCKEAECEAEVLGPPYFRDVTPNWYSRCLSCKTLFHPYTRMTVEEGGLSDAQANPSVHLIYSDSTSSTSKT